MQLSLVSVVAGLAAMTKAFWRMECPQHVGVARLDPIVNPRALSLHSHTIHGSSGFSGTSGTPELLAGNCTSCRVTQDKSAYWIPTLHFQDGETLEFEIVDQVGGLLAYYLLYGENVTAFPTDFRMLAGDSSRRNYTLGDPSQPDPEKSVWAAIHETSQADLAQRALGFNCLNYHVPPEGTLYRHYLPEKDYIDDSCLDGLRVEVMFPSCWKGGHALDSPNHKDHVAYPDLVMTGTCPPDYPVRLPSLLYEVIFNTPAFKNRKGRFVFSNGDTTGFGMHADFIMGWDESFLQQAINTCTNDSGRIEDCPLFDIVDQGQAAQCQLEHLPSILQKENVKGPTRQLPGGVRITYADGSSDPVSAKPGRGSSSTLLPTLTYKPGETVAPSESPVPGKVFDVSFSVLISPSSSIPKTTSSNGASVSEAGMATSSSGMHAAWLAPVTTTVMVEAARRPEGTSFVSTQYITKGTVVNEILWKEETVTVTETDCTTVTETVSAAKATMTLHGLRSRGSKDGHRRGYRHRSF